MYGPERYIYAAKKNFFICPFKKKNKKVEFDFDQYKQSL
jgi:hypothetical protein